MTKSCFPEDGIWLKGNIHSHSTVTDGNFTPEELKHLYISKGYSFLSITDHNICVPHDEVPEELILLTGLEHDIAYSPDKCLHVVGLMNPGKHATAYPCRCYTQQELSDQQLVDMMLSDGQFVSLAHPVWSRMEPEEILGLEGLNAIEVFNNGTEHLCHGGNAEIWWDMLLRHGKRIFATAVDDVHGAEDLFGGWVWVKVSERTPGAILEALRTGTYYSSCGPQIYDMRIESNRVSVSCSDCREIHFVTYPPRGDSYFAQTNTCITEASHKLTGREDYVRVVCVDNEGHSAWSNPIFFDERAK